MRKIEIDEYECFYSVRILGSDEFVVHFRKDGSVRNCMAIRYGEYGFYSAEEFKGSYPNELTLARSYFDTYVESEARRINRQYMD